MSVGAATFLYLNKYIYVYIIHYDSFWRYLKQEQHVILTLMTVCFRFQYNTKILNLCHTAITNDVYWFELQKNAK